MKNKKCAFSEADTWLDDQLKKDNEQREAAQTSEEALNTLLSDEKKEIVELNAEVERLREENQELKNQIAGIKAEFPYHKLK